MEPWTLIGWAVVGFMSLALARWILVFALRLIVVALGWLAATLLHHGTRNTPPAVGQAWEFREGVRLYVGMVEDRGVHLSTVRPGWHGFSGGVSASWMDKPEEWKRRIRNGKGRLVEQPASEQAGAAQ